MSGVGTSQPWTVLGLLADPARLAVLAAVVLGARDAEQIRARTGLGARELAAATRRLAAAGLLAAAEGGWRVRPEVFEAAGRAAAAARPAAAEADRAGRDGPDSAVLRTFLRDGRLVSIPAARGKRRVVLGYLSELFEPGVRYPEREVDATLRAVHPDHAALRRYLVEEDFLSRDHGIYWRSGGPVRV